jgi:hypothetical protein
LRGTPAKPHSRAMSFRSSSNASRNSFPAAHRTPDPRAAVGLVPSGIGRPTWVLVRSSVSLVRLDARSVRTSVCAR